MADFNRRGAVLEEPAERRSRFGDLGDRLTRTFSPKPDQGRARPKPRAHVDRTLDSPRPVDWDEPMPRFPITRQGYDCAAVDEHVAELEQELMDLDRELADTRARTASKGDVAAEMERIGEQTSAILIAAHEQAKETTRRAKEEADRCIADAASNAVATTADAQRQLRDLETEKLSLGRERDRLVEDIRSIAASLTSLADGAADRYQPSPDHVGPMTAAASQPAPASKPAVVAQPPTNSQPRSPIVSEPQEASSSADQPTVEDIHED
ncbi:MAG: DivIVA domain-containing protein [Solirubrobacterales bacterium]|nr:DivIVA domain-containing protein [Solirubrobacterales bacterium]